MGKDFDYTEYKSRVFEILCEKNGEDVVQEIEVTMNNNRKTEGICFRVGTNAASPIIYYDASKETYTEWDVEQIVKTAEQFFKKIRYFTKTEVKDSFDWKKISGKIFPKLINYEKNTEMLEHTPYIRFLDLAVVFFYQTGELFPDIGAGTVTVTERMKEIWGVNEEQLMKHAMANLKEQECSLKNIEELLGIYGLDNEDEIKIPLHVLTVYNGIFGAAAMLNRKFMEEACEELNCSKLWIIPSSIHESATRFAA